MFNRSRRKIIAAIMGILVLLFLGTLGVIYASSYYEVYQQNREMLESYASIYILDDDSANVPSEPAPTDDHAPGQEPPRIDRKEAAFQLSTFYSIAIDHDGNVLAIDNEDNIGGYSDDDLTAIAAEILSGGKTTGVKWNLIYLCQDKGGYSLVVFMNNTLMQESMTTLFRYTLMFGGIVIVLFFFLARHLARRIVNPLEESYTKQRQFISDAGHELKTPVAVISANSELLEREIGVNPWLNNIRHENDRMSGLVAQLLELARTENVQPQTEALDLSHLVWGEVLPFEGVAFEGGIGLTYEIADDIRVQGSSVQLKQLTAILLDNAVRHCDSEKRVILTLKKEHNHAILSVRNTGAEIPMRQREQIFERFYRADEARTEDSRHYGLGLAIAKAIVLAHKGRITVSCPQGWVEFSVRLNLLK